MPVKWINDNDTCLSHIIIMMIFIITFRIDKKKGEEKRNTHRERKSSVASSLMPYCLFSFKQQYNTDNTEWNVRREWKFLGDNETKNPQTKWA